MSLSRRGCRGIEAWRTTAVEPGDRRGAASGLPPPGVTTREGGVKRRGVLARLRRDYAAFGLWKTLQASGIRAIQRVLGVKTAAGNVRHGGRTDRCGRSDGPDGGLSRSRYAAPVERARAV